MVSLKYIHSFFHFEKQLKADPKQNNAGFLFKTKQNWRVSRKEQKTFLVKKSLELESMVSFFGSDPWNGTGLWFRYLVNLLFYQVQLIKVNFLQLQEDLNFLKLQHFLLSLLFETSHLWKNAKIESIRNTTMSNMLCYKPLTRRNCFAISYRQDITKIKYTQASFDIQILKVCLIIFFPIYKRQHFSKIHHH